MYETNNGGVRVGYINMGKVKGKVDGSVYSTPLNYSYQTATVTAGCTVTDDPARQTTAIRTLNVGDQVTYLTSYFNRNSWAYIETTTPEGLTCRGFIPSSSLDVSMTDQDSAGEGYEGDG